MKIGLLEDNPAILDFMKTALEMGGHSVAIYASGAPLLEVLLKGTNASSTLPYDIVIVDLLLPGGMSGLEAIQRIQQAIPPGRLPIIIISAVSQEELEQVEASLPGVPLLRKPFKMSLLLQLIAKMKRD